jgi:hypothetical protein
MTYISLKCLHPWSDTALHLVATVTLIQGLSVGHDSVEILPGGGPLNRLVSTCQLAFNYTHLDNNKRIMASTSLDPPAGVTRPVVFFDINIGETPAGRIKIGKSLISGGLTSGGKHEA